MLIVKGIRFVTVSENPSLVDFETPSLVCGCEPMWRCKKHAEQAKKVASSKKGKLDPESEAMVQTTVWKPIPRPAEDDPWFKKLQEEREQVARIRVQRYNMMRRAHQRHPEVQITITTENWVDLVEWDEIPADLRDTLSGPLSPPAPPVSVSDSPPLTSTSSDQFRTCQVCGNPFEARRRSAKFCSNRCKMRARNRGARPDAFMIRRLLEEPAE